MLYRRQIYQQEWTATAPNGQRLKPNQPCGAEREPGLIGGGMRRPTDEGQCRGAMSIKMGGRADLAPGTSADVELASGPSRG